MKLRIVTVSSRPPQWIQQGFEEYARRMPREFALDVVETKPEARPQGAISDAALHRMKRTEGERISEALKGFEQVVALDEVGKSFTTVALSQQLLGWHEQAQNAAFVIGGADGLDEEFKRKATLRLSLSSMTLPHQLVRVILAEQLYRAVCILRNHPYHRA